MAKRQRVLPFAYHLPNGKLLHFEGGFNRGAQQIAVAQIECTCEDRVGKMVDGIEVLEEAS